MDTRSAYNSWASQYDTNENKTRDLEAVCMRNTLQGIKFSSVLEIGCGTGKNTTWFADRADRVTAVDLSDEMLAAARKKIDRPHVEFVQADITGPWSFASGTYDLITFSLVLEHIDDLDSILRKVAEKLSPGGHVYIGELHPFKQYTGSKARFDTGEGVQVVECFNHHISDFIQPAVKYGLQPAEINEYFDDDDRNGIPRILMILLKK